MQEPQNLRVQGSKISVPRTAETVVLEPQKMAPSKKENRKIDLSQIEVSPSCLASARDGLTDEEREVLRQKSSLAGSEEELEELVRMVAEGRFE